MRVRKEVQQGSNAVLFPVVSVNHGSLPWWTHSRWSLVAKPQRILTSVYFTSFFLTLPLHDALIQELLVQNPLKFPLVVLAGLLQHTLDNLLQDPKFLVIAETMMHPPIWMVQAWQIALRSDNTENTVKSLASLLSAHALFKVCAF